jgi:anti-sigma regulatory factor (Ser/Thr protein kinase)
VIDRLHPGTKNELVLQFVPSARTVGRARRAVGQFCRAGNHGSLAEDAELLTSELATNACRHSSGLVTVLALRNGAGGVVTVTDDDTDGEPVVAVEQDPERDSGRGLFLVDAIAGAWGTTAHTSGKSVWFRLP